MRSPFGWPDELVRLVLAACFRAGAIYLEQQSASGPVPLYDYKDSFDLFGKINTFKKVTFRVAETSLSVEQLKQASKELMAMGVTGTPESGNALAAAVRKLGETLKAGLREAESRARMGLPIADTVLRAGPVLDEPTTAKDPTKAVTAFLEQVETWKVLHQATQALRTFLDANRHLEFETSRRVADLVGHHPVPPDHPAAESLVTGSAGHGGHHRREGRDRALVRLPNGVRDGTHAYRDAYREAYETCSGKSRPRCRPSSTAAPTRKHQSTSVTLVLDKIFGAGGPCAYPDIALGSAAALLAATAKHSLTALSQALMALPGYRSQAEATLRDLVAPPPPGEKIWEWRPAMVLVGQRFETEAEVDQTLQAIGDQLKAQIRAGFTVVVR